MTTLTIPANTLAEAVNRLVSMTERANSTFSRTTGLMVTINPAQTSMFVHARVSDGTIRYSEYVPCKIEGEETSWRIPIHELARVVGGLDSDAPVAISDGQPQLHIKGAGVQAKIPLIQDRDFLAWEVVDPKSMVAAPEILTNAHAVEWAAEQRSSTMANTTAVHFTPTLIAATDKYSMAFAQVQYPEELGSGMVSVMALRSIPRLGYSPLVTITDKEFIIQCSPYAQAAISLTAGEMLNFQSLMDHHKKPAAQATVAAKDFTSILRRATALTDADRQLDVTVSAEAVTLVAGKHDATIAQFTVPATVEGLEGNHTFRVNAERLAGSLREAKGDMLIGFDPTSALQAIHVLTSRSRALLMPIKTPGKEGQA